MDVLGIGPLELFFIIVIALIIFGPNDIVKATRTMGKFLRSVVTSDGWRAFQQASKGMKDLPTTLMREAGLEEEDLRSLTGMTDLQKTTKDFENQISPWTTPPSKMSKQSNSSEPPELLEESQAPELQEELQPSEILEKSQSSELPEESPLSETDPETQTQEPDPPPPDSPFSENIDS